MLILSFFYNPIRRNKLNSLSKHLFKSNYNLQLFQPGNAKVNKADSKLILKELI